MQNSGIERNFILLKLRSIAERKLGSFPIDETSHFQIRHGHEINLRTDLVKIKRQLSKMC